MRSIDIESIPVQRRRDSGNGICLWHRFVGGPQFDKVRELTHGRAAGLVSKELIHHVKSILGVDISQGQVDQYNKKVQNEGIPLEKMHAVRCELEGKEGELNGLKFDAIFVRVFERWHG